jgi:transcriptional regulator with XRE-family HTH domain
MKEFNKLPYKSLGNQLKRIRERKQESVAEVSGAVEIEVTLLTDIERGAARPSEDILMLLMNHFAISDDKAVELWELAGYNQADAETETPRGTSRVKQVMVLPMDARIAYTDMAHIVVNDRGVVMNFMQEAGLGGQPLAVARIGMSRTHAKEVLELLQKALAKQQPKSLPTPDQRRLPDAKSRDTDTKPKKV